MSETAYQAGDQNSSILLMLLEVKWKGLCSDMLSYRSNVNNSIPEILAR
jgi:hypothetical protein